LSYTYGRKLGHLKTVKLNASSLLVLPNLVANLMSVLVERLVADPVGEGDAGNAPRLRARNVRVPGL
jgi:hypothetical protein